MGEETDYRSKIESILRHVEKPSRYVGGEWNSVVKDHGSTRIKVALCFPDVYEIGMSHLGFRLLYSVLNARADMLAERAFTPWPDMQEELLRRRLPLTTLESATPLNRFDVVGFSLQYELCFTNVLSALSLSGIPLRTADRRAQDPLIIAGGPVVFNPEPVADFMDVFIIGDGEETAVEVAETYKEMREDHASRPEILQELAHIPGVYVPSLYRIERDAGTGFQIVAGPIVSGIPFPVQRRILMDIENYPYPSDIVVPFTEIVHDRVSIEIMRGCQVGCRFCQAGYIYRPVRERSHAAVMETARRSLAATGYDEVGLTSLNSGEYPGINRLISEMMDELAENHTSVSFSSLRANSLTDHLAKQIRRSRKTGFTIAPEAGTDRLRRVINKNIREEDVFQACEMAFSNGWSHIKLYFMIGQPTERREDVEGILDMGRKCLALGCQHQGRRAKVSLSASAFIPKPFTPFQWCRMENVEPLREKQEWLKRGCAKSGIRFKWQSPEMSRLEGVFSLGDRGLGQVVEAAWRRGCSFDGWTERLDLGAWMAAFEECGVRPGDYLARDFGPRDSLPWDHLDIGVTKKFLARDLEKAYAVQEEETCGGDNCYGCAPFAAACTGFLHGRRTGDVFFGGSMASGDVSSAVPGGGIRLQARQPHRPAPAPHGNRPASTLQRGPGEPIYRYRARFTKRSSIRFLSQLEIMRVLARAFRRAGIRVAYSQGYHPMPKIAFGPALAVGIASEAEFVDFETHVFLRPAEFLEAINRCLPAGMRFLAFSARGRAASSLSKAINRVVYGAQIPEGLVSHAIAALNGQGEGLSRREKHATAVTGLLRRSSIPFVRARQGKSKTVDLRPFLRDLSLVGEDGLHIAMEMDNGRTAKPQEVLTVLYGPGSADIPVTRLEQLVVRRVRVLSPLMVGRRQDGGSPDPG